MPWYRRVLTPVAYWIRQVAVWIAGRVKPRPVFLKAPKEMVPMFQTGTFVVQYCAFTGKQPEDLAISDKIQSVVENKADPETMGFVTEILFCQDIAPVVFGWLVHLGDATSDEWGPFMDHLATVQKTNKNLA